MCIRDSSYSLAWLTKALNIDNNNAHRALSDALATAELFIRMEKELVAFPDFLKEKLTQLSAGDGSALAAFVAKCCANHGAAAAPAAEKTARTPSVSYTHLPQTGCAAREKKLCLHQINPG